MHFNKLPSVHCIVNGPSGFGVRRIEPLSSPACRKRRLMEESKGLPAGAIPSVMKVSDTRTT